VHSRSSFAALAALAFWLLASSALAEASVRVELRRKDGTPVDGTVRIRQGDTVLSCTTQAGACTIIAQAGGSYAVEADIPGQPKPKTKTAMIPPSGNVKLVVAVD
jgi:hypothetical protein